MWGGGEAFLGYSLNKLILNDEQSCRKSSNVFNPQTVHAVLQKTRETNKS